MTASAAPRRTNWAGNVTFSTDRWLQPRSIAELQAAVAAERSVRPVGTGHSFTPIADTSGALVSLDLMPPTAEVDSDRGVVRVSGGLRYAQLADALRGSGLALANTASLPHISLAGACATGTHGSGVGNRVLSAAARSLTLVTAAGDLLRVERGSAEWPAAALSLGRLGVVAELELDLVPHFEIAQTVLDHPDEAEVASRLMEVLAAAYSVSVFTDWAGHLQIWVKEQVGRAGSWDGATTWGGRPADGPRHPIPGMPVESTTEQLGAPGPWGDRLPHFRAGFTPSAGAELQSEFLLPLTRATDAWAALSEIRDTIAPVLQISEVRAIAPDDLWLSPTGGLLSVAFHFTWQPDTARVLPVVRLVEERLAEFGARPHWGKVFTAGRAELARVHPRLGDFAALARELDPDRKLGNDLVDGWLGL